MSTIILLDVSLSMCRPARRYEAQGDELTKGSTDKQSVEIRQLANAGIGTLLDYLAQNVQLERSALVVFSSLWEIKQEFTRNHESVKSLLYDLELYDKSNIVNAMRGIVQLIPKEVSQSEIVNIILVTDGQVHYGSGVDDAKSSNQFHDIPLSEINDCFNFPCKIQVVLLTPHLDSYMLKYSIDFYKQLVKIVDKSSRDCPVLTSSSINKNLAQSAIWLPEVDTNESHVSIESVEQLFHRITENHYKPCRLTLACGNLCSMVLLSPKPSDYIIKPVKDEFDAFRLHDESANEGKQTFVQVGFEPIVFEIAEKINICGFLPANEVASPAVTSRHLVMPIANEKFNELSKAEQILTRNDPKNSNQTQIQSPEFNSNLLAIDSGKDKSKADDKAIPSIKTNIKTTYTQLSKSSKTRHSSSDNNSTPTKNASTNDSPNSKSDNDITKQPSFTVLLLNALKQENMVAICEVGKSASSDVTWYGMLHAQTDSKKRTSLMLSLFVPSDRPILWLPNFKTMGSSLLNANLPEAIREKMNAAYNARKHPKSYSTNNVLWLDPESVQADLHKVVRHARRSIDKIPLFYKELNRIRRAAISYGFYDVLFGLSDILEREKIVMLLDTSKPTSPEIIAHIDHAVKSLRSTLDETSFSKNIMQPE